MKCIIYGMDKKNEPRYTTAEAATKLEKSLGTVRNYVARMNLGTWKGDIRLLSDADLDLIRRARPGQPKGPRKPKPATQPTPEPQP
jgi:hypothetical protein